MLAGSEASSGMVGRNTERDQVGSLMDEVQSGLVALVIEGSAGIGKSTVWRDGVSQAEGRGIRTLVCQPGAAEAQMSFAAMSDLLDSVIDGLLPHLAVPQRRALEVALLRVDSDGSSPDHRAVSVAFLQVLRLLVKEMPLLLAVDDMQWLDRPSARVLDFSIRRLRNAPIGVLATVRADSRARIDIERAVESTRRRTLRLGPLSLASIHQLLQAREGLPLPRRTLLRIYELSGGNPFFALELTRGLMLSSQSLSPGAPLPISDTLGSVVEKRLGRLPARGREVLAVAAAAAQPTVQLLVAIHGPPTRAWLERSERLGLISVEHNRIRFAHPLLASAVYGSMPAMERRRVHRRLAEVVNEPEQRARHLALAAEGPDEPVAAALEESAVMAEARGAPEAAAELYELAAQITPESLNEKQRGRRLAAAQEHYAAGDFAAAKATATGVAESGAERNELARALHLVAKVHYYDDSFPEAAAVLERALSHVDSDPAIRAPIKLDLVYLTQALTGFPAAAEYARGALRDAEALGDSGLLAQAVACSVIADFLSGHGLDCQRLEEALAMEDHTRLTPVNLRPSLIAGLIFNWVGESARACEVLENLRATLIERGEEAQLPLMSASGLVCANVWVGDFDAAMRNAEEAVEIASTVESVAARGMGLSARVVAAAYIGDADRARCDAEEALKLLGGVGWDVGTVFALTALGHLYVSLGQPAEADRVLHPVVTLLERAGLGEPSSAPFLPDEIEALVALGELDQAERLLVTLEARAEKLDRAISRALAARCRGLLLAARGELPSAIESVRSACRQHNQVSRPVEEARTLLALGQLERRANRRRAARDTLERALRTFTELGSRQWAARTSEELQRLGLRRRSGDELTPTEQRVAEYAAAGMRNREIAAALFVSPKTVEANLVRVYRKLGISSRAELGRMMAEREGAEEKDKT